MTKGFIIVATLFLVLSVTSVASPMASEWVALALMICAGIPHGSFDLRVAEAKWRSEGGSKTVILATYLVGVIGMSGLCVFYPVIGLSLFLVISAAHFTEGELYPEGKTSLFKGVLFGIGAILLPIGLHTSEAQPYLGYFISEATFHSLSPLLSASSVLVACALAIVLVRDICSGKREQRYETSGYIICLLGWILLPPLSGFAVWFIGRHSYQHFAVCKRKFVRSGAPVPVDFLLISVLAILGLAPFALCFDFTKINQLFAASICLIAGLTLPHMVVCHNVTSLTQAEA